MFKHRLFRYVAIISITASIILLILLLVQSKLQQNYMNRGLIASSLSNSTGPCKESPNLFHPSASDYFFVKGIGKKEETPPDWMSAAYNGNQWAQCRMGDYYASGSDGFRKSLSEAFRWWNMSAEQGNVVAKSKLVEYYILNFFDLW